MGRDILNFRFHLHADVLGTTLLRVNYVANRLVLVAHPDAIS